MPALPDHTPRGRLLLLHKPKGVVVTRSDERGRRTVYSLLPEWALRDGWVPVGRLDLDSRGLLLFTPDGELVERLTRPGACPKTYEVFVRGRVTDEHLRQTVAGVDAGGETLRAVRAQRLGAAGPKTRLLVQLDEGRNRHIRRLFGALRDPDTGKPLKVMDLKRTAVGPLKLDVASGEWRMLTADEERSLATNTD